MRTVKIIAAALSLALGAANLLRRHGAGPEGPRQQGEARSLLRRVERQEGRLRAAGHGLRFDRRLGGDHEEAGRRSRLQLRDPRPELEHRCRHPGDHRDHRREADLAIIHNPDLQSYARLEQRMVKEGIKVLQVNLETTNPTDYYVGADWVKVGLIQADALVKKCGKGSGTSGKVAILEGSRPPPPTSMSSMPTTRSSPTIRRSRSSPTRPRLRSGQGAGDHRDRSAAASDLCGIVGNWDNQDVGAGAAVEAAGKSDQVYIVTSGAAARPAATISRRACSI